MIDQPTTELTILFADICRSTVLFDKLGDQAALNLVMQALEMAGELAEQNGGTVIGTIGDEVLCTFESPEAALITASQLHSQMHTNASMLEHQLAMRIGINSGAVVCVSANVYGDTVNMAARLAQQAKANQTLVSSTSTELVRENLRDQLRRVGPLSMQGKAGMIEVYELLEPDAGEAITEVAKTEDVPSRSFLMTARFRTRQMRFDPMLIRFLFGRGMDCDQTIDHPTISREHAEFLYRNGQFLLRDFSTNGSLVLQGNTVEKLHRSSIELRGSGRIFLGRTQNMHQFCIEYTVIGNG
ncbi:MAG: adenylate/guanylate cyclase domain-containing protein [Gammaproteobacteria bacterium]|nr:adenylate/guanylate cyclase domain-containing protein [Gammaproteobacteria bacterium]NNK99762.1 adenylate/guanylate cyclase domain-containing protein [Xanthomonadales bacterium]